MENNNFNLYSAKVIRRAENFVSLKTIWVMVGMTIWSLRNIFTIFGLFENDCMKDRDRLDKFWLLNFYICTFFGIGVSVITIILIPGAILY